MASGFKPTVIVRLEVINEEESGESNAYRYIVLDAPSYKIHIGRGSRSGSKDLYPARNNAWFDSRVMSREHAILKADLDNKTVTIEDVGSMHGTYLPADELKLSKNQPQVVRDGDAIIFGAEVSRGPDTFPALEIDISYSFDINEDDERDMTHIRRAMPEDQVTKRPAVSRNSFSVPDYDDYDSEDNNDSEFEVKVVRSSPISASGSYGSEDEAPYEPWDRSYCNTFESKAITDTYSAVQEVIGSTLKTKTHPADVIMWSRNDDELPDLSSVNNKGPASQVPTQCSLPCSSHANVQSTSKVQPTTLPSPPFMMETTVLTDLQSESESDYGDDISVDLFDEDFGTGNYPQSKPDNSSFSSQSPILASLPSKVELAARQSTVKVAAKPTLPRSPLLGAVPAEQRAPSPSDAAMPKATPAYPSFEYKSTGQSSQYYGGSNGLQTTSSGYRRTYDYTSSQDVTNVQDTYPNSYYPVDTYPECYGVPVSDWNWGSQTADKPASTALKTFMGEPWTNPIPTPANPFITIKTTPRVAIKDLVDEPAAIESTIQKPHGGVSASNVSKPAGFSSHKRKADQISESEDLPPILFSMAAVNGSMQASASQDQEDAQVTNKLPSTTGSQSQTDLWGPVSMIEPAGPSALEADKHKQATEERPKKKARGDLYKYAAGAMGGIAIGAVGVVAALISLPPDYFV